MQSETRISSGHLLHHMLWNPDRVVLVFFFFLINYLIRKIALHVLDHVTL